MIIKTVLIPVAAAMICLSLTGNILASEEWMLELKIKTSEVNSRLIIGQKGDAKDGKDGRYDVPAIMVGEVVSYIAQGEDYYWKDIRRTCAGYCRKEWNIQVRSILPGEAITVGWHPPEVSLNGSMSFVDKVTGEVIDMFSDECGYTFESNGIRDFSVVVELR